MDVAEADNQKLVSIDDIDGAFVPRAHPDALQVGVGEDLVVVHGGAYILNSTAALVWQCFDGSGSLDELIVDLGTATGTDDETIRHDVLDLTRGLAERGLLEGIAPPPPPEGAPTWTPPVEVAVGEVLDDFVLADLDGTTVGLGEFRDQQVLLVNWSPSCGYCLKIAAELGELEGPLRDRGVALAFVASGEGEANRQVMTEVGIKAPVLVKTEDVDPFGAFGTPAAYLLDVGGLVAAPMAYGADEVPALARKLAGVETPAPAEGVAYLPAAVAVCGSGGGGGGGGGAQISTSWEGTRPYRFGGYHVGIRYNSAATADITDRLFPGSAVDDPRAPANYAVALYPSDGRSRELNLLVKGASQLVRSRSSARVLQALLGYMSADLTPRDPALLHLNATGAVRDGKEGLLLPSGLVAWLKQLQPRLARRGIQLVDLPWASVDPISCELLVPEPAVAHDPTVLAREEDTRLGAELPRVLPGRYPLRAWFLMSAGEANGPLPQAMTVATAAGLLRATRDEFPAALKQLAAVASCVATYTTTAEGPDPLVREIEADLD